jgi:DNA-binding CsgD family transcriptional regulator
VIAVIGDLVARESVGEALSLLADAGALWFRNGFYSTEAGWLRILLDRAGEDTEMSSVTLASALLWSANLMCDRMLTDGERGRVLDDLASGLRLASATGDHRLLLRAHLFEARVATYLGDHDRAIAAVRDGLTLAGAPRQEHWQAALLCWGALAMQQHGDDDQAVELAMQALVIAEHVGEPSITVRTALVLESIPSKIAPRVAGVPTLEEMLELAIEADDGLAEAFVVARLAYRDARRGEMARALAWSLRGLDMSQRNSWWHVAGFCAMSLVVIAALHSDVRITAELVGGLGGVISTSGRAIAPSQVDAYAEEVAAVRAATGADFERWAMAAARRSWDDNLTAAMSYARHVLATVTETEAEPVPPAPPAAPLTPRERQVLEKLATGVSNKEIARDLGMRPKTVMHHSVTIYRKLGVRGRTEAAVWAIHAGLVDPGHLPD